MSLDAQAAFEAAVALYRRELLVHCYRMLGFLHDAEDLLQETMLRAWRAADRYDESRASLWTWLYRIATNVCFTALQSVRSRPLSSGVGEVFIDLDADFVLGIEVPWLVLLFADSEVGVVERSWVRIVLVAALQLLPVRQRAVLFLREVLELPAAQVGAELDMFVAVVNSALQRARVWLAEEGVDPEGQAEPLAQQRVLVDRYVEAFERADVLAIVAMLADDVVMEMPPMWNWYRGRADYGGFMECVFCIRGISWQTKPVWANGEAVFFCWRDGEPHSLQVAIMVGDRIIRLTVHADSAVFVLFS